MKTISRPLALEPEDYKLPKSPKRGRFSPLMLIGIGVTVLVVVVAGFFALVRPYLLSHAAADNMDCSLIVPANPLSAQGLATPYQLTATDAANGPCNEANAVQAAFVQGAVFDPATGQVSIYNPLVVDKGTKPAAAPVMPQLPAGAVVGLWFGFNGANLTLQNSNGSLQQGKCVNGVDGSIFGQFAYCNAPAFFRATNMAVNAGTLVPPALGTGKDGLACPTVRDFGVVDQDQSDNVTTTYLVTNDGRTAQMTTANAAALQNAQPAVNGSDNRLVAVALDGTLGCTPWAVPDLADPGHTATGLPLNELQAAAHQAAPVALVPAGDPMVLNNGNTDLNKVNAYRRGVDQAPAANADAANTTTYCQNLASVGAQRIVTDAPLTVNANSPDPAVGNTLFTFLAQRFANTYGAGNLNCVQLLGKPSPIATTQDGNGVAISATFNGQPVNTQGTTTGTTTGMTNKPDCNVNGTKVAGCNGTATINGQTCTLAFMNNTVNVTCPNGPTPGNTVNNSTGNTSPLNFNNVGGSNDDDMAAANFDGWGNSYSVQALQNAGITSGKPIVFNGVTFTWPNAGGGMPNNVLAQGQVITITPVQGATTLAFLGSATNGPSGGKATITYSDGTAQTFQMLFSDWTLNAGKSSPSAGNQTVAVTPYRNTLNGMQMHKSSVFYIDVALMAGKTVQSVTLPSAVNQGKIHVFAISTK